MMVFARAGFAFLLAIALCPTAKADDCKLVRLANLDTSASPDYALVVPVSIEGTTQPMAIDTGSPISVVDPVVAAQKHLITHRIFQDFMFTASGRPFTDMAVLHSLDIGDMHAANVKVLVWPNPMTDNNSIAGTLGADLLRHYDIDLDVDAKKLSLFSQNHCPGKVVYWGASSVAVLPMHVVNSGHIIVPVVLDGHSMDALLDTGSTRTNLSLSVAENLFGIKPGTPGTEQIGEVSGVVTVARYRHTFHTLALEGIAINNPEISIWDDLMKYAETQTAHTGSRLSDSGESEGKTDLILGLHELRHLHVYIAYGEQKLYISASQAAAQAATAPAAAPSP